LRPFAEAFEWKITASFFACCRPFFAWCVCVIWAWTQNNSWCLALTNALEAGERGRNAHLARAVGALCEALKERNPGRRVPTYCGPRLRMNFKAIRAQLLLSAGERESITRLPPRDSKMRSTKLIARPAGKYSLRGVPHDWTALPQRQSRQPQPYTARGDSGKSDEDAPRGPPESSTPLARHRGSLDAKITLSDHRVPTPRNRSRSPKFNLARRATSN